MIFKFVSIIDLPLPNDIDVKPKVSKVEPVVVSYLAVSKNKYLKRISGIVTISKRNDSQASVIYNSFRDFNMIPPSDSKIVVEVYHSSPEPALLGRAEISILDLDEEERFFPIWPSEV